MTLQLRKNHQTTVQSTRTALNALTCSKDDSVFFVRASLFSLLLIGLAGFGNSSTGQDYVGRRSRVVIRNIRDADVPAKPPTQIRPAGRRQQPPTTDRRGWAARTTRKSKTQQSISDAPRPARQIRRGLSDDPTANRTGRRERLVKKPRADALRRAFRDRPSPARNPARNSPLRWRDPQDSRPLKDTHRAAKMTTKWTTAPVNYNEGRNRSATVRRAAHLTPLDPFDDPFGDKQTQHTQAIPEPNRMHSVIERQNSSNSATASDQDAPPSPLFQTGTRQNQRTAPQMIKRDCAAELARCRSVERNPLSSISLDITPSLKSSTVRGSGAAAKRQLQQARARTWKNRAGDIVAEGKLTSLEFGRAIIVDQQGETRRVPINHLSDADLCVVATLWNLPAECILDEDPYIPRKWLASTMTWKASAVCHRPLYFEQVQLERYGHTAGPLVQPVVSGAHFFTSLATLPYKMGINPPNECRYPLGHYRPGNCAPWLLPPVPLSVRGGLLQAGVMTGGAALLP